MKYFYLSVLIVILASCSLTKQIEKTGYTSIAFGTGGGFTNQITTYTLSADGSLWKQNNLSGRVCSTDLTGLNQPVRSGMSQCSTNIKSRKVVPANMLSPQELLLPEPE